MPPYGETDMLNNLLVDDKKDEEEISANKPSMKQLNVLVKDVVSRSSWWDLYGCDLAIMCINFALLPISLHFIGSASIPLFSTGYLMFAYIHATFTVKLAHAVIHNALAGSSRFWNGVLSLFFIEIWGGFTVEGSYEAHIHLHHPYTNVIGLGDSSSWRVPFLGRNTYLFIAPLFLQLLYPVIGLKLLVGRWLSQARFLFVTLAGYILHFCLFHHAAGLSVSGAILCNVSVRAVFALPFIHVNIFQHIGLPMYDVRKHPKRLYQMASSACNLPRNPLLDFSFGHSSISCHVEHHLFPWLSDNMCLKIKPVVSSYLKSHGLPYHEASYLSQLQCRVNSNSSEIFHLSFDYELIGFIS